MKWTRENMWMSVCVYVCTCSSVFLCARIVFLAFSQTLSVFFVHIQTLFFLIYQLMFSLLWEKKKQGFLLVKILLNKTSFWHKSVPGFIPVLTELTFLFSTGGHLRPLPAEKNVCVYRKTKCHLNCVVLGQQAGNELRWAICPTLQIFPLGGKKKRENKTEDGYWWLARCEELLFSQHV